MQLLAGGLRLLASLTFLSENEVAMPRCISLCNGQIKINIWVATRSSTSNDFANVTNLSSKIKSPRSELGPFLYSDGLTLMFSPVSRGGRKQHDLYFATRPSTDAPFQKVVAIGGAINTVSNEYRPCLAESGTVLYFYSNRPGGLGHADIWVSRRVPRKRAAFGALNEATLTRRQRPGNGKCHLNAKMSAVGKSLIDFRPNSFRNLLVVT